MSEEIDILNKRIGGEYVTLDGHKIFRLVWSEGIFENRHGTFREFTEAGLFIREVTETRKVRKYNYIHNRWIFEMWAPGNLVGNPETPDAINGDYVPVYVFESSDGGYLPPNEKVVRFLIAALHGKIKRDEMPSQEYLEEKEIQASMDTMDDHPNWFQTRPGLGRNAIWFAGDFPSWRERRATFDTGMVTEMERRVHHEAMQKALAEERKREIEVEKVKAEVRETIRLQELEKQKIELAKTREKTKLAADKTKQVEKPEYQTRSPMHQGRK